MTGIVGTFVLIASALAGPAQDQPIKVDLGGMRQVKASLQQSDADWLVTVQMVPVQCFDKVTNAALNREKARLFGLQALAKHFSGAKPVQIVVHDARVEKADLAGNTYELCLRVPRQGVEILTDGRKPLAAKDDGGQKSKLERATFTSALFTRKSDYSHTLERLSTLLAGKLRRLEAGEGFDLQIAKLEEEGVTNFDRLTKAIQADRLLLNIEKDELELGIQGRVSLWKNQLKQAVRLNVEDQLADKAESEQFSEVQIDKRFRSFLLGNPLLMEVPGAKVIRLHSGSHVILAVSSTVLKDQSPEDRLRAEKVCRIKALASLVAEQKGVQVAHTEQVKEQTVIVLEGKKEKVNSVSELLQITKAEVQGIVKDFPVIGRWKSRDGSIFYLAIGAILNRDGRVIRENVDK